MKFYSLFKNFLFMFLSFLILFCNISFGNAQQIIFSVIPYISFSYSYYGQVTKTTDPNGNITEYQYYPDTGYLWKTISDPSGINAVTTFAYDDYGNINSITDANDHTTSYVYNQLNWLVEETNSLGYKTKYTHDANGNVTKIEKQANEAATQWQTTTMTYDILNHLLTVKDPLNHTTTYTYDANENQLTVKDAQLNTTSSVYDERDLLLSVTDANSPHGVTKYDYDLNGNLAKITDANGNPTTYVYDLFDRQQNMIYADGKIKGFEYDKNSNLTKVNLPSGKYISYDFDALNQMTTKTLSSDVTHPASFVYDLGSRLTDANNPASQIHYDYDALNRVASTSQTFVGHMPYTISYMLDKVGNRKQLTYPSGKALDYIYTADDQLNLIKEGANTVADFDYDVLGRRSSKTINNQLSTVYAYDSANQLTSLTNSLISGGNISQYQYPLYDTVGNRKQMIRKLLTNASKTTNYTYNKIYELTAVTGAQTNSYDYDAVHNREVANVASYTTNNVNQYTDVAGTTLLYDDDGNLGNDGENNYTYDEENNLRTVTLSQGHTVTSAYDALGRRVSKTADGSSEFYIYDGDSIIADYNNDGSLEAEYLLSDNIDEVLAMERAGETYYYNYDGLGSVTEITDDTGSLVESYTYDVYGNPTIRNQSGVVIPASAGIHNRYLFTGREYDYEAGLYHYRARAYSPMIGRFLQFDPKEYEGGMNLYEYAYNNPTNFVDPDGELAFLALIPIAYAAVEFALSISDAYSTASTLADPCSSGKAKALSAGLFIAGALAPGGGYSTTGKIITKSSKGRIKKVITNLSKPNKNPGLSQQKLNQLQEVVENAGGKIRVDLKGVKGTGVNPHAQVEGLGARIKGRHIWLQKGVQ